MPKGYRAYLPNQDLLLPPSLREWLAEEHLVYFVSDVVDQLDLSAIHAVYEQEKRGQPPYDPRLMTKLLSSPALTSLMATRCWNSPSARRASYTVPIPPRPSSRVMRYAPTFVPIIDV